ncbi:MAG TPA: hypothetical protein VEC37_19600 [Bacillota bacterium]|nr:hypothetical protein [Bacillota bacterium]
MFKKLFIGSLILTFCLTGLTGTFAAEPTVKKTHTYYNNQELDVFIPAKPGLKPVIFMAHNGGSNKDAWQDFPQQIATETNMVVVSINWNEFKITADLESAFNLVQQNYADQIDLNRAAYIGGCHGGTKFAGLFAKTNTAFKFKTFVLLSLSEPTNAGVVAAMGKEHPPVLAYYTLKDRLGEKYQIATKKFAEEVLTQPKTVIALNYTPHGDELVANDATKVIVRTGIINWLKASF